MESETILLSPSRTPIPAKVVAKETTLNHYEPCRLGVVKDEAVAPEADSHVDATLDKLHVRFIGNFDSFLLEVALGIARSVTAGLRVVLKFLQCLGKFRIVRNLGRGALKLV